MKAQAPDADSDLEARTMHVFVTRALQTILKDAPKKHAELRKACTSVIGALLFPLPSRLRLHTMQSFSAAA